MMSGDCIYIWQDPDWPVWNYDLEAIDQVLAKCFSDTALRDISELQACGVLNRSEAGGRNTSYELVH